MWSIGEEYVYDFMVLRVGYDLYLLKFQVLVMLSLVVVFDLFGVMVLNFVVSNQVVQDKVVVLVWCVVFGICILCMWVSVEFDCLQGIVGFGFFVVKLYNGYYGYGVQFLDDVSWFIMLFCIDTVVIVQERVVGVDDLKVYVIGDDVFGVRKVFDLNSYGWVGVLVVLLFEVVDVVCWCGVVFGFGLYGIDVVEIVDGVVVIDVNGFFGYKGVFDVVEWLCDYVFCYVVGAIELCLFLLV